MTENFMTENVTCRRKKIQNVLFRLVLAYKNMNKHKQKNDHLNGPALTQ